jgi:thiamine pyrophosphokinase
VIGGAVRDAVVVVAGGSRPSARALASLPDGALVIGADRGAEFALAAGLAVEVAVGDFDSISAAGLERLERSGARIERHPAEKEATDLELALAEALSLGARRILVIGAAGGRLDHLLGELSLLASDALAEVEVDAVLGRATVNVVRGERVLAGRVGELVSLLPLHGPASGVTTEGLVYPLRGETLVPGSSRGVSNVFAAEEARVSLERGVLLAVRPGRVSGSGGAGSAS